MKYSKRFSGSALAAMLGVSLAACGGGPSSEPSSSAETPLRSLETSTVAAEDAGGLFVAFEDVLRPTTLILRASISEQMDPVDLGGGPIGVWTLRVEEVISTVGSVDAPSMSPGDVVAVLDVHDLPIATAANVDAKELVVGISLLTDLPYQKVDVQWRAQWVATADPALEILSSYPVYDQQLQPYLALEATENRLAALVELVKALANPGTSEVEERFTAIAQETTDSAETEAGLAAWNATPREERGLQVGVVPDSLLGRYEAIGLDIRAVSTDMPGLIQVMSTDGVSHAFLLSGVESHVVPALRIPGEVLEIYYIDQEGTRTMVGEVSARRGEVAILEVSVQEGVVKVTQSGTRTPSADELKAAEALGIEADGSVVALPDE